MDDSTDLTYVCPVCGQAAVAGKHFCKSGNGPKITPFKSLKHRPRKPIAPVVSIMAGVLLVVVLLWMWIGSWSLPLAAAGLFVVWVSQRGKDSPAGKFADLVKLCSSKETAERLVASEAKRNPGYGRKEAVQAALDRLRWDRSR